MRKLGLLQSTGMPRVGDDLATQQQLNLTQSIKRDMEIENRFVDTAGEGGCGTN